MFKGSKGNSVWVKVQHKSKTILSPHLMISLLPFVSIIHEHIYNFEILHPLVVKDYYKIHF